MTATRGALALCLAATLAGCATLSPPAPASAPPGAAAPTPAAARAAAVPTSAASDSGPSQGALDVLASIPEPLEAGEQVAPPEMPAPRTPITIPAPPEGSDTLRAGLPDPESIASTPVPTPVAPLGQPRVEASAMDSTAAAPPSTAAPASPPATTRPPATPPPAPPTSPPPAAAPEGPCWRLQIAAPLERVKGEAMRDAAESQLLLGMAIDLDGGRWKVRSRDCWSRDVAERVQQRALDSGFKGAFLVRGPSR